MPRTVVIGGGIVGAATAWNLAMHDDPPTVFDRRDDGRTTDAGAGISYAPSVTPTDDASLALAIRANRTYDDLIEVLETTLGEGATGVTRHPLYKVALNGEADALNRAWEWVEYAVRTNDEFDDETATRLDASTVEDQIPGIGSVEGGVRFETGIRIDGRAITDALLEAGEACGMTVRSEDVRRIRLDGSSVTGVVTAGGETVDADRVVITGGAWSCEFAAALDVQIPVHPVRGQIVHLEDAGVETDTWPMVSTFSGRYLVPWADGHVAVGATHEEVGYDARPTVDGVCDLLSFAESLMPELGDATFDEVRVGLRPASTDGKPIIGSVPGIEGAFVVTGHGGGGLQRGPLSGRLLAETMTGTSPSLSLEPFSLERFSST